MKDQHGCDKLSKSEMLKVIKLEFESYLPKLNSSLRKFLLVLKSVSKRPRQHMHELKVWKCFKVPSFNFFENFCGPWTQGCSMGSEFSFTSNEYVQHTSPMWMEQVCLTYFRTKAKFMR